MERAPREALEIVPPKDARLKDVLGRDFAAPRCRPRRDMLDAGEREPRRNLMISSPSR
jgi:hypothetical protein